MATISKNDYAGARGMWLKARAHEGRYLLPRRFGRGPDSALYKAADWLVRHGYARWLPWSSTFAPGIETTQKPW